VADVFTRAIQGRSALTSTLPIAKPKAPAGPTEAPTQAG
jgi:hypothetical protein